MAEVQKPTIASRTLSKILEENGVPAKKIRARFDKAVLWRLATGRRRPEGETAALLAHLTGAKVLDSSKNWIPLRRWLALVKA